MSKVMERGGCRAWVFDYIERCWVIGFCKKEKKQKEISAALIVKCYLIDCCLIKINVI